MIFHQTMNSYGNYNYNAFVYTDIVYRSHFHRNYELIYNIEGTAQITVNGIVNVLKEGEIILISPYTIHSLEIDKKSKTWVGVFSEDYVVSFSEKNRRIRYTKFRCSPEIEKILKKILFFKGQPEHYMLISALYMVLNECVKNADAYDIKESDEFIYSVTQYISNHLSDVIYMKDISDKLGYEYHYFSSIFHKCFGMNFKNFINIFRIENACRLLQNTEADITGICNECGFGSIRNFNRTFKNVCGFTSGEYRKALK